MAAGWVKSWQCKSNAFDDVYHPNSRNFLPTSSSCRKSAQNLKDVIDTTTHKYGKPLLPPKKSHSSSELPPPPSSHHRKRHSHSQSQPPSPSTPHSHNRHRNVTVSSHHRKSKSQSHPHSHSQAAPNLDRAARHSVSGRLTVKSPTLVVPEPFFPSLSELPGGHPSRNVVEIIFHTRWGPKGFSGRVEMVFKIQNMAKTVTRFEEYKESIKSRAGTDDDLDCKYDDRARCVADGNEMMRFHCLGPTSGVTNDAVIVGGFCAINGGKKGGGAAALTTSICTYAGSGAAHDSAGGGKGRRAMLVCRVVAGRVYKGFGIESVLDGRVGFDSVSGQEKGELLVFDPRAVLPCFLVIYKL